MFLKLVFVLAVLLGFGFQAHAHAIILPALGMNGTGTRNSVQRPTNASMCGKVNIADTLTTSGTIPLGSDSTFSANITNFNGGQDGSREVTAALDATAIGTNFVSVTVLQNGDLAPAGVGSQTLIVQLPGGTVCSGGPDKNLCLVSFKTAGGFGNCIVLQQSTASKCKAAASHSRRAVSKRNLRVESATTRRGDMFDVRATGIRAVRVVRRAYERWS